MKMTHTIGAAVLLGASVAVFQVGAFASGSAVPSAPAGPSMPSRSPEEMAIASYNSGIDHKDKGLKLEAAAACARRTRKIEPRLTTRRRRNTRRR